MNRPIVLICRSGHRSLDAGVALEKYFRADAMLSAHGIIQPTMDAREAPKAFGVEKEVAPVLWLGNSDHHLDFPGTLSAPPRPYLDVLVGLAENVLRHGFKRVVFFNGHGGNDVPGRQVVFELRQRHRDTDGLLLLFATYWSLGGKPFERPVSRSIMTLADVTVPNCENDCCSDSSRTE